MRRTARRLLEPVHELQRLPGREYQSERSTDGLGESVPAADAALDGHLPPVRRSLRRSLRAGMDPVFRYDQSEYLGQNGVRSGERQRSDAMERRLLVVGAE